MPRESHPLSAIGDAPGMGMEAHPGPLSEGNAPLAGGEFTFEAGIFEPSCLVEGTLFLECVFGVFLLLGEDLSLGEESPSEDD